MVVEAIACGCPVVATAVGEGDFDTVEKLNQVARAGGGGFDAAHIAQELHAAMDQIGTDEGRIYASLRGLSRLRGAVVRKKMLCQDLPLPTLPQGMTIVVPAPDPTRTTRERFSVHSSAAACAGCQGRANAVPSRRTPQRRPIDLNACVIAVVSVPASAYWMTISVIMPPSISVALLIWCSSAVCRK